MASVSDNEAAERRSGWRTIRKVTPYLWPKGQAWAKQRVVLAMLMLLAAKLVTAATPFLFGISVDALAEDSSSESFLLALGGIGLVVAYGFSRLMTVGFQQLRDVIFAKVGQRALRRLALETFEHIHALSLRYHITRKTGGLSRIIERGVKGVEFLLRFRALLHRSAVARAGADRRLSSLWPLTCGTCSCWSRRWRFTSGSPSGSPNGG